MHKLLTTPEEEQERMAYLNEISKRERQNAQIIEKLESELKEKNNDKNEEVHFEWIISLYRVEKW